MKQIIKFNDEYYDIIPLYAVREDKAKEKFYEIVKERVKFLMELDDKEAEKIIHDEDDESVIFNDYSIGRGYYAYATIHYGCYNEYLILTDIPCEELPNEKIHQEALSSPKDNKIEVNTSAGVLRAYKSTDPGQPGICVVLQPAGYDSEIDLSYVSVYEDPEYRTSDNERPVDVSIMTYADAYSEDYTSKQMIRREDVMAALKTE